MKRLLGGHRLGFLDLTVGLAIHEHAFDLGQDLRVGETTSGYRTGRAGRHAGATALAKRLVDFGYHQVFVEEDGIERTQVVADSAARAFFGNYTGSNRF
jgi:hypothetical protein